MSENLSLNIADSDCFAALRAAGAGAAGAHLHRVEGKRAGSWRSGDYGHPRVGGLDGCDGSVAQKAAADGVQRWLTLWIALKRIAAQWQAAAADFSALIAQKAAPLRLASITSAPRPHLYVSAARLAVGGRPFCGLPSAAYVCTCRRPLCARAGVRVVDVCW